MNRSLRARARAYVCSSRVEISLGHLVQASQGGTAAPTLAEVQGIRCTSGRTFGLASRTSWTLAFQLLPHDQQIQRIRRLAAEGWPEMAIVGMTNWDLSDVRRAVSNEPVPREQS